MVPMACLFWKLCSVSLLFIAWHGASALPCEETGLCSIGKLNPFVGDIRSSDALRAALAARSYKKEIIILVATAKPQLRAASDPLLPTVHIVNNFRKFGIEHILLLSTDRAGCRHIIKYFPHIGCAWNSFQLPIKGRDAWMVVSVAHLWHTRWRTTARAVRLSYNVMCMDADVILFDEPYRYFKSPPFKDFTIINQPELLFHQDDYPAINGANGGIVYIQNARPDGVAAWLVAEVSDRVLRWVEDDFNTTLAKGFSTACCYMDQDCFNDAISSVQIGRPTFYWSVRYCTTGDWKKTHQTEHHKMLAALEKAAGPALKLEEFELPFWMEPVAGAAKQKLRWFTMQMPNVGDAWLTEFGGNFYPEQRRNMSLEFQKQLREDCGCPLWPDPEDGSHLEAARKLPQEKFLYAPPFLMLNYWARGRFGYWNQHLTGGTPQQVIGHAQYIPLSDPSINKNVAKMVSHNYDWSAAHKLSSDAVFFANQGSKGKPSASLMLALHPTVVQLNKIASWEEFQSIVQGLAQVAAVAGRTVLWPALPCNHSVVLRKGRMLSQPPLPLTDEWLPWGPASSMQCLWLFTLNEGCLFEGRGMLPIEFEHFKEYYGQQLVLEPNKFNTIAVPVGRFARGDRTASPAHAMIKVPEADVRALLADSNTAAPARFSQQPILYLAHPLAISKWSSDSASRDVILNDYKECHALHLERLVQWVKQSSSELTSLIKLRPGRLRSNNKLFVVQPAANATAAATAASSVSPPAAAGGATASTSSVAVTGQQQGAKSTDALKDNTSSPYED